MIPPAKEQPRVLQSKDEICRAFQIGEVRLRKWRDRGLPVKVVDGRLMGHYDEIESFIKFWLVSSVK